MGRASGSGRAVTAMVATGLALLCGCATAAAQSVADFYRGKSISVHIGYAPGGAYDLSARVLARHMGRHIPGEPTLVPRNMPGAGSLKLANYLYNVAPHDGTEFGIFGRTIPIDPLLGSTGAQFDALKFTWLGSTSNEVSTCVSWHTSAVKTATDLFDKELSSAPPALRRRRRCSRPCSTRCSEPSSRSSTAIRRA